jgi:hypothetical protein
MYDKGKYVGYNSLFKLGNTKLSFDTIIFNMTTATECPSKRLGLCRFVSRYGNHCYAYKAEYLWKYSKAYRIRQAELWSKSSACDMISYLEEILNYNPNIRYFRYNEAGDFREQTDVQKLNTISNFLKHERIITYGYTARSDLNYEGVSFIVRGSGWKGPDGETQVIDFHPQQEFKTDRIKLSDSTNKIKLFHVCPGTGCGDFCKACMGKIVKNICFIKH